ncbi:hypothetical protein M100_3501 [Bacteroides fragilis str. 1007-1-F |nr:hypothetical protein M100_3501 [Bacteroides fragilis str. 1007-1-F \
MRTVPKEINTFSAFILPNCMKVVFFQVLKGLLPNGLLSEWSISIVQ